MYTEEDLRATLGALEQETPDEGRFLAGLERARRRRTVRRRTAGVIAVAVAAAVVVAGSIAVPQLVGQADQVAANPHFERWRYPFAVDDIPGYQVIYQSASSAQVSADTPGMYHLEILPKGRYDPTADQAGEPVDVRGKHGFYRADMNSKESVPGVVWEYAPDSWAWVMFVGGTASPDPREAVLRIAGAVRFDRTAPLRVPFRVGYVPAGLQAVAPSDISFTGTIGAEVDMAGNAGSLSISAGQIVKVSTPSTPTQLGQPVSAMDPATGRTVVEISFGQLTMRLTGIGISTAELKKIARSITPAADPDDRTTWFDADKAIPLH